jgi:regulator of sirC expression with transglutaminase-like and TPR domain
MVSDSTMPDHPSIRSGREEALVALLDDPAPTVRAALREAFRDLGGGGVSVLRRVAEDGEAAQAAFARELLEEFVGPDPVDAFLGFIRSFNYELETGSLMLDRTHDPEVDVGEACHLLDSMARRARELMVKPATPWEHCKVLNRVIFHEYGFRGDPDAFINPQASFLTQVLRRRRGMPLTLCVVYLLVAYRLGLELEPVSLPGRFMVGCLQARDAFYIDCFEHGVFRGPEDIRELFRRSGFRIDEEDLRPSPVGDVLRRACRNLVNQFREQGDFRRAGQYERFVHEFELVHRRNARS